MGKGLYARVRESSRSRPQVRGTGTPFDRRRHTQTEGSLVVDVDTLGNVRQGDNVDVVSWLA
jgi:hypothetical protein